MSAQTEVEDKNGRAETRDIPAAAMRSSSVTRDRDSRFPTRVTGLPERRRVLSSPMMILDAGAGKNQVCCGSCLE